MKRNKIGTFVVGLICLAGAGISSLYAEDKDSENWKDLVRQVKNPKEKIFEHWAVVEPVPLVKKVDGVPSEFSSCASILLYLDSYDRFTKGDEMVFGALLNRFEKYKENSDFVDRLFKGYSSSIAMLERDEDKASGLSEGQDLVKLLYGKSKIAERAVFTYLNERLYLPVIRTEITSDTARTLLDCGTPFVLIKDGKSFICLGYVEKAGKPTFIVADPDEVEQGSKNRAASPSVQGDGEAERKVREFCASMDKQFGQMKIDIKFSISDNLVKGVKFIEINKKCGGVAICRLSVDESKINEFIESHKTDIAEVIKLVDDEQNNRKKKELK